MTRVAQPGTPATANEVREARKIHRRRRRPVVESAGALVWRVRKGVLEVQLVHRPAYQDWSWPKGKVDVGESLPAAAVREVEEETGTAVVLGMPLPSLKYRTDLGRLKRVHYWAAQQVQPDRQAERGGLSGSDGLEPESMPITLARESVHPVNVKEIDQVIWLPVIEARAKLTRHSDRGPLDALVDAWGRGRLTTRVLVVARHARAQKRAVWPRGEDDRPLTPIGYQHAAALIPLLSAFGITHIVSSPWRRCTDTIGPYSHAGGITPTLAETLSEAGYAAQRELTSALVKDTLSRTAEHSTVLCTHRPVLGAVMRVLRAKTKKHLRELIPVRNPYLRPGSLLVAHVAHGTKGPVITAVETWVSYKSGYGPRPTS